MNWPNFTVLIVDDVVNNIKVAMETLQTIGCEVVYATSGEQAIERAKNSQPDLILLDIMMPDINGFDVCKTLKADKTVQNIPIIFLSADNTIDNMMKGFECGAVDYINKPFRSEELKARVLTHLKLYSYEKSLESQVKEEIRKNQEKEKILFQQSKMAAMGEMIENIAHQWRQPLSIISTSATGLRVKSEMNILKKGEEIEVMDHINIAVQHLSQTINDFRDFFKVGKEAETFLINGTFEKTFKLITLLFDKAKIVFVKNIQEVWVRGFEYELIQVIVNIFNNSRDELIKKEQNPRLIVIDTNIVNNYLEIDIKDNADGIPVDVIDKIFESYFTTKHDNDGTGIGLYMSKKIIEDHMQGTIKASNVEFNHENIVYTGAQFKITIPIENKK